MPEAGPAEHELLRQSVRDFAANTSPEAEVRRLMAEWSSEEEARLVTEARRFKALEYDAGFGWIDGPAVYGGRGLPRSYHEAYTRLREQFAVPDLAVMRLGLSMTAPTILGFTWEHPAHLYFRRAKSGEMLLGTPTYHRRRFARLWQLVP